MKKISRAIYWSILKAGGITPEKKNAVFHQRRQQELIGDYLAGHQVRKLQIGAQSNSITGWLNVDIAPKSKDVCYMDATQPFPIGDDSFDYVYAEHMIEHIPFEHALFMLRECCRILKPGGRIRIATPDLSSLVRIMTSPDQPEHKEYILHYRERFFPELPADPAFVVNKLFYGFHHRFIHNFFTLHYLLDTAGFSQVSQETVGSSPDPLLCNMEQHWKEMGELPNRVETIVVEGVKVTDQ